MSYDTPSSISLPLKIKIEHKDGFTGREINFFFLIALGSQIFQSGNQFKTSSSPFLKTNKTFFYTVNVLDRPCKIK